MGADGMTSVEAMMSRHMADLGQHSVDGVLSATRPVAPAVDGKERELL